MALAPVFNEETNWSITEFNYAKHTIYSWRSTDFTRCMLQTENVSPSYTGKQIQASLNAAVWDAQLQSQEYRFERVWFKKHHHDDRVQENNNSNNKIPCPWIPSFTRKLLLRTTECNYVKYTLASFKQYKFEKGYIIFKKFCNFTRKRI